MVTPQQKRDAAELLKGFGLSAKAACRLLNFSRSSCSYKSKLNDAEGTIAVDTSLPSQKVIDVLNRIKLQRRVHDV